MRGVVDIVHFRVVEGWTLIIIKFENLFNFSQENFLTSVKRIACVACNCLTIFALLQLQHTLKKRSETFCHEVPFKLSELNKLLKWPPHKPQFIFFLYIFLAEGQIAVNGRFAWWSVKIMIMNFTLQPPHNKSPTVKWGEKVNGLPCIQEAKLFFSSRWNCNTAAGAPPSRLLFYFGLKRNLIL